MAPNHQRIALSKIEAHHTSSNPITTAYHALLSPKNYNVVKSVAMFGVRNNLLYITLQLKLSFFTSS